MLINFIKQLIILFIFSLIIEFRDSKPGFILKEKRGLLY